MIRLRQSCFMTEAGRGQLDMVYLLQADRGIPCQSGIQRASALDRPAETLNGKVFERFWNG
jgi:hypothetical protein